jgi:hypothetical protein
LTLPPSRRSAEGVPPGVVGTPRLDRPSVAQKRVQAKVFDKAQALFEATALSASFEQGEEGAIAGRDPGFGCKESLSQGAPQGLEVTRFLLPSVPCPQGNRGVQAGYRRVPSEQVSELPPLQDGDSSDNLSGGTSGRLVFFDRSLGRVPSCTTTPVVSQVPQGRPDAVQGVQFSCSPVWPLHGASGFYQNSHFSGCTSEADGGPCTCLLGRLALLGPRQTVSGGLGAMDPRFHSESRVHGQHEEIQSGTEPTVPVPGSLLRHSLPENQACGPLGHQGDLSWFSTEPATVDHAEVAFEYDRFAQFCSGLCSAGSSLSPPDSVLAGQSLESGWRGYRHPACHRYNLDPRPVKVVGSRLDHGRDSSGSPHPHLDSLHRCVAVGMGCNPGESPGLRPLDTEGRSPSHQCAGTVGGSESSDLFSRSDPLSLPPTVLRQCDLCRLLKETRGHQISGDEQSDVGYLPASLAVGSISSGTPHSVSKECFGRCFKPQETLAHGVVSGPPLLSASARSGSSINSRPVCDSTKQPARSVCQSMSRSEGLSSRCPVGSMEVSGHPVCFSSTQAAWSSSEQDQGGTSSSDAVSGPMLATSGMVHGSPRVDSLSRPHVSSECIPTSPRSLASFDAQHLRVTRLDAIRKSFSQKGYSASVVEKMAKAGRESTNSIYDGKWKLYSDWCLSHRFDPFNPDGPQVASFFDYLFTEKGLAFSTIRGYKASLWSVLASTSSLSEDIEKAISRLFSFFAKHRPANIAPLPNWNLSIVLTGLKRAPFAPLGKLDLPLLLKKTLFLIFLAAGSRRSEVLAFSRTVVFRRPSEGQLEAILSPIPGFVPKTKRGLSANRPFVIRALPGDLSPEEQALCPVRALKAFLKKSRPLPNRSDCLFFTLADPSKALTTHGLKAVIVDTIELAYKAVDKSLSSDFCLRLHELRRLSFSVASAAGVSLEAILAAGRWIRPSTFTNHYLQSTAFMVDNWRYLGPIVVAQSVVNPPLALC